MAARVSMFSCFCEPCIVYITLPEVMSPEPAVLLAGAVLGGFQVYSEGMAVSWQDMNGWMLQVMMRTDVDHQVQEQE